MEWAERLLFRSRHIYILCAGLVNLAIGVHYALPETEDPVRWCRRRLAARARERDPAVLRIFRRADGGAPAGRAQLDGPHFALRRRHAVYPRQFQEACGRHLMTIDPIWLPVAAMVLRDRARLDQALRRSPRRDAREAHQPAVARDGARRGRPARKNPGRGQFPESLRGAGALLCALHRARGHGRVRRRASSRRPGPTSACARCTA